MIEEQDTTYHRELYFALLVMVPILVFGATLVFAPLSSLLTGWIGIALPITGSAMVDYWLVLDRRFVAAHGGASVQVQALHLALFALTILWLGLAVASGRGT